MTCQVFHYLIITFLYVAFILRRNNPIILSLYDLEVLAFRKLMHFNCCKTNKKKIEGLLECDHSVLQRSFCPGSVEIIITSSSGKAHDCRLPNQATNHLYAT